MNNNNLTQKQILVLKKIVKSYNNESISELKKYFPDVFEKKNSMILKIDSELEIDEKFIFELLNNQLKNHEIEIKRLDNECDRKQFTSYILLRFASKKIKVLIKELFDKEEELFYNSKIKKYEIVITEDNFKILFNYCKTNGLEPYAIQNDNTIDLNLNIEID